MGNNFHCLYYRLLIKNSKYTTTWDSTYGTAHKNFVLWICIFLSVCDSSCGPRHCVFVFTVCLCDCEKNILGMKRNFLKFGTNIYLDELVTSFSRNDGKWHLKAQRLTPVDTTLNTVKTCSGETLFNTIREGACDQISHLVRYWIGDTNLFCLPWCCAHHTVWIFCATLKLLLTFSHRNYFSRNWSVFCPLLSEFPL